MANAGIKVKVVCLAAENVYQGDALIYLKLCLNEKIDLVFPSEIEEMIQLTKSFESEHYDLIIDALLGTGTRGQVREPFSSVIKAVPTTIDIIAVDLPSGMNGNTGEICGVCIKAKYTRTFAAAKTGLLNHEEHTGKLFVTDIGMPPICLNDELWNANRPQ